MPSSQPDRRHAPERPTPAPWRETLNVLRERFGEDRLALTASSLTFTTLISLVPLVTVMLALFSAFPAFAQLQDALQKFFVSAVVPEVIAKPVLGAVTQFSSKANRLGALGLGVFLASALALMLTIDRTLNTIWRVPRPRPLAQRVLIYWAAITLGPVLLASSIGATSVALAASRGWQGFWGEAIGSLLATVEFGLLTVALAALYHYVPNTSVRWRHAAVGGLVAAMGLVFGKQLLAWYLKTVPTFSLIYGAFATVPILLVWMYMAWAVTLLGAVVAAYAPTWESRVRHRPSTPSLGLELALEVLGELQGARQRGQAGMAQVDIARALAVDPLQLEPVVGALLELDWVGELDEAGSPRLVLLCEPERTRAAPLLDRLLLTPRPVTARLRAGLAVDTAVLSDWLAPRQTTETRATGPDMPAAPSTTEALAARATASAAMPPAGDATPPALRPAGRAA